MVHSVNHNSTYIVGLAHAYPQYSLGPKEFEAYITRLYPEYQSLPGLQKLIKFNHLTQIQSRRTIFDLTKDEDDATPPTLDHLSKIFREDGVNLASLACMGAMKEAGIGPHDITHVVAVTCTDQSNPGYDLLVSNKLKLRLTVQRTLLHGVGCAGGLSALRAAANIAAAESQRHKPARILVMACELCSLFLKAELDAASRDDHLHIAPALFSDAAAALVVCNSEGLEFRKPVYELREWGSMVVPDTRELMSYDITSTGMIASMTKKIPQVAVSAISPLFNHLTSQLHPSSKKPFHTADFDWAIHPGGAAILQGAQHTMHLDDHLRASWDIYQSYGNSSSPTVLVVLDRLRDMGPGRDDIVAASFGPGLLVEMCLLRKFREGDERIAKKFGKRNVKGQGFVKLWGGLKRWVEWSDGRWGRKGYGPIML